MIDFDGKEVSATFRWFKRRNPKRPDRITRTGETFEERKAWHDRGELSPGEHAMARAIRERLVEQGLAAKDAEDQ